MNSEENKNISVQYVGGLGNQLFCIYTALAISLLYNLTPIFEENEISPSISYRLTYWKTLFKNLKTISNFKSIQWHTIDETVIKHREEDFFKHNNILLKGYFQSYHYFINELPSINKILCIEDQKQEVYNKYRHLFSEKVTALHFRLGDYKRLQQHHPLLPDNYYINALNHTETKKILVFCEKEDKNIVLQKMNTIIGSKNIEYQIIEEGSDLEQMFLISLCDTVIMANSTYSWWGALYNNNNNIYIPYKWFFYPTNEGLIMKNWNVVNF